eukprot:scaffold20626_cov105-Isochrysis_galbana.AAC.1
MPWSEVWRTLCTHGHAVACGRRPRADDGGAEARALAGGSGVGEHVAPGTSRLPPQPLALVNGVIGTDAPKRVRRAAQSE